MINCNSTSCNIMLHMTFDQTRKIRYLVCKFCDTSASIFHNLDGLENLLAKKAILPLRHKKKEQIFFCIKECVKIKFYF
ncbi:hypothetical protein HZS_3141 [Henneguya salminicola]|nr:hypothetical protein HZS_3141 [Henneguya salminicola]